MLNLIHPSSTTERLASPLLIAGLCFCFAGCRAGVPGTSMVRVSKEAEQKIADVPAPEQRLATTKIGTSSARTTASKSPSAMPGYRADRSREIAAAAALLHSRDSAAKESAAGGSLSDRTVEKPANNATVSSPAAPTVQQTAAISDSLTDQASAPIAKQNQPDGELVSASLTDVGENEQASPEPDSKKPDPKKQARTVEEIEKILAAAAAKKSVPGQPEADTVTASAKSEPPPESDDATGKAASEPAAVVAKASSDVGDLKPSQPTSETIEVPTESPATSKTVASSDSSDGIAATPAQPTKVAATDAAATSTLSELSEGQLYQELLERIAQGSPDDSPVDRERRQIVARHLMVLAGDPTSAVASMEGLNENQQQYLRDQLMGLWTLIDPEGHPSSSRRVTQALPKFRSATQSMAAATDSLALNNLEFCTEIETYGQIKPFAGNRFTAGQQVILYCEVENFAAAEKDGLFQTQLQGNYDIYDANGTKVVGQMLPVDQQRSRNRLRDYFVAYQMYLPKQLPAGTYRLQLTIEDPIGKKYGQANIPFEIQK